MASSLDTPDDHVRARPDALLRVGAIEPVSELADPVVPSVLVVEDDADVRMLLLDAFETEEWQVHVVSGLHDALEAIAADADQYDVVVLDLHLPDDAGSDALSIVGQACELPIVVYSSALDLHERASRRGGRVTVVAKTEPLSALVAAVDRARSTPLAPSPLEALPEASADVAAPRDFTTLANQVVAELARLQEIHTWMVTRVVEDDWIVLSVSDTEYGLRQGDVLRWSDSFCSRMVRGGPRIITDSTVDRSYADAPIGQRLEIAAYVGIPLAIQGEGLFGTLCGISPRPLAQPAQTERDRRMFELLARTLASAASLDLERSRMARRLDIAAAAARVDSLTGLGNRRAWEGAVRSEGARNRRFGHRSGVLVIDLDGLKAVNDQHGHDAGDRHLRAAAQAIGGALRSNDRAFRLGGDEFGVLLTETRVDDVGIVAERVEDALVSAGIAASIGGACGAPGERLAATIDAADAAMYAEKQRRR